MNRVKAICALLLAACGLSVFGATTTYTWNQRCAKVSTYTTVGTSIAGDSANNVTTIEVGKQKKFVFKATFDETDMLSATNFVYAGDDNNITLATDSDGYFNLEMTRTDQSTLTAKSASTVSAGDHIFAILVRRGVSGSGHVLSVIVYMDGSQLVALGDGSEAFHANPMRNYTVGDTTKTGNIYTVFDVDKEAAGAADADTTTMTTMVADAAILFTAPTALAQWDRDFTGADASTGKVSADNSSFSLKANGNTISNGKKYITISGNNGVLVDWDSSLATATTENGGFGSKAFTMLVRYANMKGSTTFTGLGTVWHSAAGSTGSDVDYAGVMADTSSAGTKYNAYGINNGKSWTSAVETRVAIPCETSDTVRTMVLVYQPSSAGTECYIAKEDGAFTKYFGATGLKTTTSTCYLYGAAIGGVRNTTVDNVKAMTGMKILSVAVFNKVLTTAEMATFTFASEQPTVDVTSTAWNTSIADGSFTSDNYLAKDTAKKVFSNVSLETLKTLPLQGLFGGQWITPSGGTKVSSVLRCQGYNGKVDSSDSTKWNVQFQTLNDGNIKCVYVQFSEQTEDGVPCIYAQVMPTAKYIGSSNGLGYDFDTGSPDTGTVYGSDSTDGIYGIAALQIVSSARSFSINVANNEDRNGVGAAYTKVGSCVTTSLGLEQVPVNAWTDCVTVNANKSGTYSAITEWTGSNTQVVSTVSAAMTYPNNYAYKVDGAPYFLNGYLDDSSKPTITVYNVPYSSYDVIVYGATDNEGKKFSPVTVNGTTYTYDVLDSTAAKVTTATTDVWGYSRGSEAKYATGVTSGSGNAIRIRNQTSATLTVAGGSNANSARGGLAAIQIVCTGEFIDKVDYTATITADGDISTIGYKEGTITGGTLNTATITVGDDAPEAGVTITLNDTTLVLSTIKIISTKPVTLSTTSFANVAYLDLSEATGGITVTGLTADTTVTDVNSATFNVIGGTLTQNADKTLSVSNGEVITGTGTLKFKDSTISKITATSAATIELDGNTTINAQAISANVTWTAASGSNEFKFSLSGNTKVITGGSFTINSGAVLTVPEFYASWGYSGLTVNGTLNVTGKFSRPMSNGITVSSTTGVLNANALGFGNNGTLTFSLSRENVGSGGIVQDNTNGGALAFGGNTTLGAYADWSCAKPFTLATGITFNTLDSVDATTARTITLSGIISDASGSTTPGITKTGAGTLNLNAANTFTGGVTVNGGKVVTGNADALGTGTLTIAADGTLEITGQTITNAVTLTGGELKSTASGSTVSGPITVSSASKLAAVADATLALTGALSGSAALTLGDATDYGEVSLANATLTDYSGVITANGRVALGSNRPKIDAASTGVIKVTTSDELATTISLPCNATMAGSFGGVVEVYNASGTLINASASFVAGEDGSFTLNIVKNTKVQPYKLTISESGDINWTKGSWKDSTTETAQDVVAADWGSEANVEITVNEGVTATLTADRLISLGTLTIKNAGTLTIQNGTTANAQISAVSIIDTDSTGTTTVAFPTDTATVTAGANTIVNEMGTGKITIATDKKLTVKKTTSSIAATKVTNSGTLNFEGGTEAAPINLTGDGDFGTTTLAAGAYVLNTAGNNHKYLVTGEGSSSRYAISGNGFSDNSAFTNVTLVSKSDLSANAYLWIEKGIGDHVFLEVPSGSGALIGNDWNGYNPTFDAMNCKGTITCRQTSTITLNSATTSYVSGTCEVGLVVAGSGGLYVSGTVDGDISVNEGKAVAMADTGSITGTVALKGQNAQLQVPTTMTSVPTMTADEGYDVFNLTSGTTKVYYSAKVIATLSHTEGTETTTSNYTSLYAAYYVAEAGDTITLQSDTTVDSTIGGSDLTIDFQHHKVTGALDGYGLFCAYGGAMTLKNGTITNSNGVAASVFSGVLKLEGMDIVSTSGNAVEFISCGGTLNANGDDSSITTTAAGKAAVMSTGSLTIGGTGNLTLTGTATGISAVDNTETYPGDVTINNTSVTITDTAPTAVQVMATATGPVVTLKGGVYNGALYVSAASDKHPSIVIEGGTYNGSVSQVRTDGAETPTYTEDATNKGIAGGTFSETAYTTYAKNYVADGYAFKSATAEGVTTYTVLPTYTVTVPTVADTEAVVTQDGETITGVAGTSATTYTVYAGSKIEVTYTTTTTYQTVSKTTTYEAIDGNKTLTDSDKPTLANEVYVKSFNGDSTTFVDANDTEVSFTDGDIAIVSSKCTTYQWGMTIADMMSRASKLVIDYEMTCYGIPANTTVQIMKDKKLYFHDDGNDIGDGVTLFGDGTLYMQITNGKIADILGDAEITCTISYNENDHLRLAAADATLKVLTSANLSEGFVTSAVGGKKVTSEAGEDGYTTYSLVENPDAYDEIGVIPYHWYDFNGNKDSKGEASIGWENNSSITVNATGTGGDNTAITGAATWGDTGMVLGTGDYTIVLVGKMGTTENGTMLGIGSINNSNALAINSKGSTSPGINFLSSGNTVNLSASVADATTAFHQYALVKSGTTYTLYVDGEQADQQTGVSFTVGQNPWQLGDTYGGTMTAKDTTYVLDDFRVYHQALTVPQLKYIENTFGLIENTWLNGTGDGKWSTAANWSAKKVPAANEAIAFYTTGDTSITMDAAEAITTGAVTFDGTGTLTMVAPSGTANQITAGGDMAVNTDVAMTYSLFNTGAKTATVASGKTLSYNTDDSAAVVLAGEGTFEKTGSATVWIGGTIGALTHKAGTLNLYTDATITGTLTCTEGSTLCTKGYNCESGATLTVGGFAGTVAYTVNGAGTFKIAGETSEGSAINVTADNGTIEETGDYLGNTQITIDSDKTLTMKAADNCIWKVSGDTGSTLIANYSGSGTGFGLTDGSTLRNLTLSVPSTGSGNLWIVGADILDGTVDLDVGREVKLDVADATFTVGSVAGTANIEVNSGKALNITGTSTYTGSINVPVTLTGAISLTLNAEKSNVSAADTTNYDIKTTTGEGTVTYLARRVVYAIQGDATTGFNFNGSKIDALMDTDKVVFNVADGHRWGTGFDYDLVKDHDVEIKVETAMGAGKGIPASQNLMISVQGTASNGDLQGVYLYGDIGANTKVTNGSSAGRLLLGFSNNSSTINDGVLIGCDVGFQSGSKTASIAENATVTIDGTVVYSDSSNHIYLNSGSKLKSANALDAGFVATTVTDMAVSCAQQDGYYVYSLVNTSECEAKVGDTWYATIADAIASADGAEITLQKNTTYAPTTTGAAANINVGEHTLAISPAANVIVSLTGLAGSGAVTIGGEGTVVITGDSTGYTGNLAVNGVLACECTQPWGDTATVTVNGTLVLAHGAYLNGTDGISLARVTFSGDSSKLAVVDSIYADGTILVKKDYTGTPHSYEVADFTFEAYTKGVTQDTAVIDDVTYDRFTYTPEVDGAACLIDFTFTNTVATVSDNRIKPAVTCQNSNSNYYFRCSANPATKYTNVVENTQVEGMAYNALLMSVAPWRGTTEETGKDVQLQIIPTNTPYTVAIAATFPTSANTAIFGVGSAWNGICLATGADAEHIKLIYINDGKVHTSSLGTGEQIDAQYCTELTTMNVPYGDVVQHTIVFETEDHYTFYIYVDGTLWTTYTFTDKVQVGTGWQVGAMIGGAVEGIKKTSDSGAEVDHAYISMIRLFEGAMGPNAIKQIAKEFPYNSPSTIYDRLLTAEDNAWEQAGKWVVQTNTSETASLPAEESRLVITNTTSSVVTLKVNAKQDIESLRLEGKDAGITLAAGSGAITSYSYLDVQTDVTNEYGAIDISEVPVIVAAGKTFTYDLSSANMGSYTEVTTIRVTSVVTLGEGAKFEIVEPTSQRYGYTHFYNDSDHSYYITLTPNATHIDDSQGQSEGYIDVTNSTHAVIATVTGRAFTIPAGITKVSVYHLDTNISGAFTSDSLAITDSTKVNAVTPVLNENGSVTIGADTITVKPVASAITASKESSEGNTVVGVKSIPGLWYGITTSSDNKTFSQDYDSIQQAIGTELALPTADSVMASDVKVRYYKISVAGSRADFGTSKTVDTVLSHVNSAVYAAANAYGMDVTNGVTGIGAVVYGINIADSTTGDFSSNMFEKITFTLKSDCGAVNAANTYYLKNANGVTFATATSSNGTVVFSDIGPNQFGDGAFYLCADPTILSTVAISGYTWGDGTSGASGLATTNTVPLNMIANTPAKDGLKSVNTICTPNAAINTGNRNVGSVYRIPAVAKGTKSIVAMFDCRYYSHNDLGTNWGNTDNKRALDQAACESTDGGQTWTKPAVVIDVPNYTSDSGNASSCTKEMDLGDPCIGFFNGKFYMMAETGVGLQNDWANQDLVVYERAAAAGSAWEKRTSVQVAISNALVTAGETWPSTTVAILQGPGHAITNSTQIIFPMQLFYTSNGTRYGRCFAAMMDASGNWTATKLTTSVDAQECSVAELDNGDWYMIAKKGTTSYSSDDQYRYVFVSSNHVDWIQVKSQFVGKTPFVQGSMLKVGTKNSKGVYVAAMDTGHWNGGSTNDGRDDLTLFIGTDNSSTAADRTYDTSTEPITWDTTNGILLYDGYTEGQGYNSIVQIDKTHVGVLFEAAKHIYFKIVDISAYVE